MTSHGLDEARHPWTASFAAPSPALFVDEQGKHAGLLQGRESWSVARLLSLAGDAARAIPAGLERHVAIRSRSAAFLVASLLGAWSRGAAPILLDPDAGPEASGPPGREGGFVTLAPAHEQPSSADVSVQETGHGGFRPRWPGPAEPVLRFLTSGSTGRPKIVAKRDYQFQRQSDVEPAWLGLDGPIRAVSLVPAHHILGYMYGVQLPARTGGCVVFPPESSPHAWVEAIRLHRPNLVVGVPLHYRLIGQALTDPLPEAVYVSSGGMLPASVDEAFRARAGWPIVQVYGSTEAGGIASRIGAGAWQSFPGVEWKSTDGDRLAIRSPWQDPFDAWHVLDDAVDAGEGGGFTLLGRADSVVKVGGRRYSLAEISQAAQGHPDVEQAHVVTYTRYSETAVALFVVARRPLTAADLRSFLSTRLASFKVPRTIRVVEELPSRGIGKVDERALRHSAASQDDKTPKR